MSHPGSVHPSAGTKSSHCHATWPAAAELIAGVAGGDLDLPSPDDKPSPPTDEPPRQAHLLRRGGRFVARRYWVSISLDTKARLRRAASLRDTTAHSLADRIVRLALDAEGAQ